MGLGTGRSLQKKTELLLISIYATSQFVHKTFRYKQTDTSFKPAAAISVQLYSKFLSSVISSHLSPFLSLWTADYLARTWHRGPLIGIFMRDGQRKEVVVGGTNSIGPDHLPSFLLNLCYLTSINKATIGGSIRYIPQTLRWLPPLPFPSFHRLVSHSSPHHLVSSLLFVRLNVS